MRRLAAPGGVADIRLYVFRHTYAIVNDLPAVELSVFTVGSRSLQQMEADAWICIFPHTAHKTEYMEPARPALPAHVRAMFDAVHAEHPHVTTVSVMDPGYPPFGINYDVDSEGRAITVRPSMVASTIVQRLDAGDTRGARELFRVHRYGESVRQSDVLAVHFTSGECTRMTPQECRVAVARDLDGLNCTRKIMQYM